MVLRQANIQFLKSFEEQVQNILIKESKSLLSLESCARLVNLKTNGYLRIDYESGPKYINYSLGLERKLNKNRCEGTEVCAE